MYFKDFVEEHKKTVYTVGVCVLILLIIVTGAVYRFTAKPDEAVKTESDLEVTQPDAAKDVVVHVKGGVANPGVYTLPEGARVINAIESAGGVGMNSNSLDELNLAEVLKDGQEIVVPGVYFARPVNINTASVAELAQVPGMPKWLARDIVSYRQENGPYKNTSEILNILGAVSSEYNAIKNYITVEDFEEGVASHL